MKRRITSLLAIAILTHSPAVLVEAAVEDPPEQKESLVTFDDHVRPIFREHCFTCHNQNDAKSGLALDSYASVIEGGSSGEVVFEDDLDSSRLWTLVSHQEEPVMPPGQDKLPDAKLALISKWIELGMPENSGAASKTKKKTVDLAIQPTLGRPSGPAAMPEGLSRDPVVSTPRAAAVSAIAASPWAPLLALSGQQQILLYHADSGALLGVLPFPEGIAHSLYFSRDGSKLLAGGGRGGYAGCAVLFDVRTGERLVKVGDELDAVLAADVNPELTRIALGGPGRIVRIFSTETGELLHEIRKHTDWIYAIRFSPDGVLLATADRSNGLFVWEADTAREYLDLRGHSGAITDVAWRGDSNVLASSSLDGTARLWEMNDGKSIARATAHGGGVNSICFTHDGRIATAGQDRTAKLWTAALKPVKTFPKFGEPALEVAITHDGKRVVAGDWAGLVRVWEATDAKEVASLAANPPTIQALIARHQEELKQARDVAARTTNEVLEAQKQLVDMDAKNTIAIAQQKQKVQLTAKEVEQTKKTRVTLASQMTAATEQLRTAQQAVQQAQAALQAATEQLNGAKSALAVAQQKEKDSQQRLPQVEQRLKAAQAALANIQEQAAKKRGPVVETLPAKKKAAESAQSEVVRLTFLIKELEAEANASKPD